MNELDEIRRDAIIELINISFGRAMADLADWLRLHLKLSVPNVHLIENRNVVDLLMMFYRGHPCRQMLQSFRGRHFFGEALFVVPTELSTQLVSVLEDNSGFWVEMEREKLEYEVLLEVGNIVIGACLGKLADLLKVHLSFTPPHLLDVQTNRWVQRAGKVMIVDTSFRVANQRVTGHLFLFFPAPCLGWLMKAIDDFVGPD